ncbi:hypothetical protein L1887_01173 [Cichorium endivia]|nr:hypothetical protein L1887_01173 [Cichorium endivia]
MEWSSGFALRRRWSGEPSRREGSAIEDDVIRSIFWVKLVGSSGGFITKTSERNTKMGWSRDFEGKWGEMCDLLPDFVRRWTATIEDSVHGEDGWDGMGTVFQQQ